jgi:uncharacterized protein (DUF1697 family)
VGGKVLKMDKLKSIYESLGLNDVQTYIQSGNVFFNTPNKDIIQLKISIESAIKAYTDLDVSVTIIEPDELKQIINNNPLNKDVDNMHVTILSDEPDKTHLSKINLTQYDPDKFIIVGKAIYLYCPNGYGRTKLTNNFFEAKLKVKATTRNWNTINKLYEIAVGKND